MGQCYVLNNEFAKGNNCFKNALRMLQENRNFNGYCSALNSVIDAVLNSTELDEENRLFKLDQLVNDMEFSLKYVDVDYGELYVCYVELGKACMELKRDDVAGEYVGKAFRVVMEGDHVDLLPGLLSWSYEVVKKLGLVDELVDEGFIKTVSRIPYANEEMKSGLLALSGMLTEKGCYGKALELVHSWLECCGYGV